ncbi:MAG: PH domain-containing protein [Acidobacteriota bacterium]
MLKIFDPVLAALLQVPGEPRDPSGDAEDVLTFKAAPGFYRYRLLRGAVLPAIAFGIAVVSVLAYSRLHRVPDQLGWLAVVETVGLTLAGIRVLMSFLLVGLDYRYRWYKVGQQSLRIREGVFNVREMTMTFANIQNMGITQGPLQRLFGIADLQVQSAGGGGAGAPGAERDVAAGMHVATFRGVENAAELRNLISERLRRYKSAGLGDHEERDRDLTERSDAQAADRRELLIELVREMRRLRLVALGRAPSPPASQGP